MRIPRRLKPHKATEMLQGYHLMQKHCLPTTAAVFKLRDATATHMWGLHTISHRQLSCSCRLSVTSCIQPTTKLQVLHSPAQVLHINRMLNHLNMTGMREPLITPVPGNWF
jgi:hypothetical protein